LKLGEKVTIHLEGDRIIIQRVDESVWDKCTGFLPEKFEKTLTSLQKNSAKRFKKLGIIK